MIGVPRVEPPIFTLHNSSHRNRIAPSCFSEWWQRCRLARRPHLVLLNVGVHLEHCSGYVQERIADDPETRLSTV